MVKCNIDRQPLERGFLKGQSDKRLSKTKQLTITIRVENYGNLTSIR